ncbi:restriction endonuclease-like protein [Fuchsiella alkaliacetigena]|uniref:restriction endonuclease-like protein n=1 Tax=Fuchsiella alkaliacetigena TaxID=957042 RepID=UPI002009EE20|nr:restriction endonuclease-like protein [Fuchsiella alkaliacetigena]MCK8825396.1 restriction endonuclease-like protein [Fuchsiella alkaliacetigena]
MTYQRKDIELINIETADFKFTIKGKPVHPDVEQLYPERDSVKASLEVNPINTDLLEFLHFVPPEEKQEYRSDSVYPFFFEWQDYQLIIQSKDNSQLEFYHSNRGIRESVTPLSGDPSILTGQINFRNDVGYSELEIRKEGIPLLILKIEVFPSKLDYQQDYNNLLREVNQEVYNLAYDFLRRTFQEMSLSAEQDISHSEFFTILDTIFTNFKKAFRRIKKSPHHRLNETRQVRPASKVKKINKQSIKWLRKNPAVYDQELELPVEMLDIDKRTSFDTFENKFVKWMIEEVIKKTREFLQRYRAIYGRDVEVEVVNRARSMISELDYILKRSFLSRVGELYKMDSLSLVLQMAPGYREMYKYYLMLKKGLNINGEVFNQSMKETWKLYEYWCFLKINRILSDEYELIKSTLIDFDYSGIYVTLNTSRSAEVEYKNTKTGEKFKLGYNLKEGVGVTTGQKPDTVLSLQKENSQVQYKFVFDAKYRLNPAYPDSSYGRKYAGPGPEEETINTMHRYRDAIVYRSSNDFKRTIVGAYILFPYNDEEEFRNHHFYQSIEQVNVGAFPFLPDSTELVSEFLEELIEETPISNYERNLLPQGVEEYQQQMNFEQNVLVGSLRNKEQLELLFEKKYYHTPCTRVNLEDRQLKYVAIYQSKKKFSKNSGVRYYGRIKNWEVKKRKEIDIPLTKANGEQPYYLFSVEEWQELDRSIKPEGYGVSGSHIYTNDMLLFKAKTVPELSIKSLKEWRVWLELSRLKKNLEVITAGKKISSTTQIEGFKVDDVEIIVSDKKIIINRGDNKLEKTFQEFIRNLRGIINSLFK